ncbi:MAG: hypothetical protein HKN79_07900 [Flavobacteriales bacterium]|nr:hypothetical protein [Flavobacteriales bacterium]
MRKYTLLLALLFGTSVMMAQEDSEEATYGKHLVTISPMSLYGSDYIGDIGLGLAYENYFNDKVSLSVPLAAGLVDEMLQAGLGLKFYPSGHESGVTYSISPMFLLTYAKDDDYYYYDHFSIYIDPERTVLQFGFMLINGLNVMIDEEVYLGLEGGFGVNYVNRVDPDYGSSFNADPTVSGMLRLNFGYRF